MALNISLDVSLGTNTNQHKVFAILAYLIHMNMNETREMYEGQGQGQGKAKSW